MRRHLLDLVVLLVVASITLGYLLVSQPGAREIALRVYVFFAGGVVMLGLVAAVGDALPRRRNSELERALAEPGRAESDVDDLRRMEREVTLGVSSAYDLHYRLLPHLREIAESRLERSGRRPSPETLGRWWELLRPDRPEPSDRRARGLGEADLRSLVEDLERM